MKTTFTFAAAVLLGGIAFGTAASAAPMTINGAQISKPDLTQVRMMRGDRMMMRDRMMRKRMMKRRMMKRRMMNRM